MARRVVRTEKPAYPRHWKFDLAATNIRPYQDSADLRSGKWM